MLPLNLLSCNPTSCFIHLSWVYDCGVLWCISLGPVPSIRCWNSPHLRIIPSPLYTCLFVILNSNVECSKVTVSFSVYLHTIPIDMLFVNYKNFNFLSYMYLPRGNVCKLSTLYLSHKIYLFAFLHNNICYFMHKQFYCGNVAQGGAQRKTPNFSKDTIDWMVLDSLGRNHPIDPLLDRQNATCVRIPSHLLCALSVGCITPIVHQGRYVDVQYRLWS